MANQKQNLVVFGLIAVIAIAVFFVVRAAMPKRYPRAMADWTCVNDGYKFVAPAQPGPIKCPKDGGEAVQTVYYYDSVHQKRFEAYETKPVPTPGGAEKGIPPGIYGMFYKVPGGKWIKSMTPPRVVSPYGKTNPNALKYSPPK
jgi:hypothetical protein